MPSRHLTEYKHSGIMLCTRTLTTDQSRLKPVLPPGMWKRLFRQPLPLPASASTPLVATLLLLKNARFHDEKTLDSPKALDHKYVIYLSDYKRIDVYRKNRRVFDEHYIFIYLPQTRWSMEYTRTRKHLFFYALKFFNMPWSATLLHMVNYHIGEKDQPHIHAIPLEKFLVFWNVQLRQMGKWHSLFHDFQLNMVTTISRTHRVWISHSPCTLLSDICF